MDRINNPNSKLSYEEILEQNTQLKKQVQELKEKTKRAEDKYLYTEKYKHTIEKLSNSGSWELDLTNNKQTWSKNYCLLLGYKEKVENPDEQLFLSHVYPEDLDMVKTAIQKSIAEQKPMELEFRFVPKDGTIRYAHSKAEYVFDKKNNTTSIVGIFRDITEQKEYENKYINIIESSPLGIIIYTLADDDKLIFKGYNKSAETILGVKLKSYIGKTIEKAFPALVDTKIPRAYKKVAKTGEMFFTNQIDYDFDKIKGAYEVRAFRISENNIAVNFSEITERLKKDAEIKESQQKYKSLYENAPLSYQSLDIDGNFIDINPTWLSTLGYKRDEVIGKNFADFLHPDWKSHFETNFPAFKKRGYVSDVQFKIRHKKGHYIDISFEGCIGTHPDGSFKQTYCVFKDITEQKRVEDTLVKKQYYLTKAQEIGKIGTWELDIINNKLIWTKQNYKNFGVKYGTPLTLETFLKCIYPEDSDFVNNEWNAALKGKPYDIEHRVIADGEVKWLREKADVKFDETGKAVSAIGFTQDITKFKEQEKKRRESERKFRILADSTKDWEYWVDENNDYVFISPACKEITGYTEVEFYKNPRLFEALVREDYKNEVINHIHDKGSTEPEHTSEFPIINKNGKKIWIEHHCSPMFDNEGKFIGRRGNNRDITARKIVEKELLKAKEKAETNEAKFRNMYEYSATGIAIVGLDFKIINANKTYCKILGYKEDELIGKTLSDITHPETIEKNLELQRKLGRGEISYFQMEKKFIHKSGNTVHGILNATLIKDNNGQPLYFIGNVLDITNIKEYEFDLKEAKEQAYNRLQQIELIQANTPNVIWKWDIDKDGNYINVYISEVADKFLGLTKGSINNSLDKYFSYILPEYLPLINDTIKNGIDNPNKLFSLEYEVKKADGKLAWFLSSGKAIPENEKLAIYGSTTDITEKKQNEQKLLRSDRVFNLTLDMFCIAGFDGYFKYLNPAWKKTLGWSIEELQSKPWIDFVHPDDIEKTVNVKSVLVDGKEIYQFENRYICKDGSVKWLSWNSHPFPKEDIIIGAVRDITETKRIENELVQAKEKAEESDRLKTAFLANMSHEIRTPMNGILGFTSLLQDADLSVENQKEYIDIIQKSGNRLLNTVNDIIEISKIESGEVNITKSEVNFTRHLDTLVTFFKPEAKKKNIDLIVQNNIEGDDLCIQTDKTKLSSILSNLIKNAIKYTNEGTIKIGCEIKNNQVLFTCQDTGIGIPKNRQKAIFNRFEQADIEDKHAHQGSGLGLAIVKSYAEMLDGRIWVESEVGKGSTFYVSLPFKQEKKKKQIIPEEAKSSDSGIKSINVLVVEDDDISSMHLSELLKDKVKNFISARNGVEAIDAYKNNSGIDLILMDLKMPVMGGIEATRKIREFNKDVVIIAQTAYAFETDKQKALDAGCNDYISKPINKDKFF